MNDCEFYGTNHSPFGKRCCGIHDPRVSGANSSWLPHTETQGNTIATDINVDCLHQKRQNSLIYRNPFGSQLCLSGNSAFSDLYRLICRIDYSQVEEGWIDKRRRGGLGPISKLHIALQLRGDADWQYKYRPQHIIHDELCMVLQKRAFQIGKDMEAREISLSTYNPRVASHVLVREVAFGPDSDPTVRGVSLWFNIGEDEVQLCTPQQAKRFRWKRGLKNNKDEQNYSSIFETVDSFPMIRPDDKDAFDLATDIMEHRCAVMQTERLTSMRNRFEALKKLEVQKKALQERFENQKKSWAAWAWPINVGRGEKVNKNTPVPPVDSHYVLERTEEKETLEKEDSNEEECVGSAVTGIWESFLSVQSGDSEVSYLLHRCQTAVSDRMRKLISHWNLFVLHFRSSNASRLEGTGRVTAFLSLRSFRKESISTMIEGYLIFRITRYRKTANTNLAVDSRNAAGRHCC
jgi:hypothetical protein